MARKKEDGEVVLGAIRMCQFVARNIIGCIKYGAPPPPRPVNRTYHSSGKAPAQLMSWYKHQIAGYSYMDPTTRKRGRPRIVVTDSLIEARWLAKQQHNARCTGGNI
ncbi:hypothetical protein POM88_053803 [Heracleum sosnowskyi]|uniref:Uncharacterized protein n=1 Tax=Heracleum sosnowskyi TaxID=360622 RepID=A0AAD8GPH3_9APIA|nr:hypothetical protein POM88_053803 [Heracleum sosnowskyi]